MNHQKSRQKNGGSSGTMEPAEMPGTEAHQGRTKRKRGSTGWEKEEEKEDVGFVEDHTWPEIALRRARAKEEKEDNGKEVEKDMERQEKDGENSSLQEKEEKEKGKEKDRREDVGTAGETTTHPSAHTFRPGTEESQSGY